MAPEVLICDDSGLARRQVARALPSGWLARARFAADGDEALRLLRARSGRGEPPVLFLDLNMPGLDGYRVLEALRREGLPVRVVVVSGDLQPEARRRVRELGAMAFLRKPVSPAELRRSLAECGLGPVETPVEVRGAESGPALPEVERWEVYRELANVASGRAADLLARLLGVFVLMPQPHVSTLGRQDLAMILKQVSGQGPVSAVCQGFVGPRLAGEALLLFDQASVDDLVALATHGAGLPGGSGEEVAREELALDVAGVLVSAFLRGLGEQLDVSFHQARPRWLGRHVQARALLRPERLGWRQCLAMEVGYRLEGRPLRCDLLLLFTQDSVPALDEYLCYLMC